MKRRTVMQGLLGALASPFFSSAARGQQVSATNPGRFTAIVLPDTQFYSLSFPDVFMAQTRWIVEQKETRNIRFVLHEGDITNNNSHPEWANARRAMDVLLKTNIPYVLTVGNHDLGAWGRTGTRETLFNEYFTFWDYERVGEWGIFEPGRLENAWRRFETPWGPILVMALEFGPRDEVVSWANDVVGQRGQERVILLTHAYLYSDGTRYDWTAKGEAQRWNPHSYGVARVGSVNDGEQLWEKLISKHPNVFLTLNGHVLNDGVDRLISKGQTNNTVHQILVNYQTGVVPDRPPGGGGYLRILEFQEDGKTIRNRSYSPFHNKWLSEPDQEFEIRTD